jgi:serine/threonine-protein kinase
VSHPNVCRVYDAAEYDGHTFLSMEYVDGEDLASLIRRVGRFPQDRAIELARQICAGLAAAHDRGVVHRDLKPANIMLDGSGKIRITDFGLAGATGEVLRAGTPAYMAPEQLEGADPAPAMDVYALAAVAYEAIAGRPARRGRTQLEIVEAVRAPVDFTGVPEEAATALARGLAIDPADRPPSATALLDALAPKRGLTPLSPPPLAARAISREKRRKGSDPFFVGVVVVVLVVVAVVVLRGGGDAPRERASGTPAATATATATAEATKEAEAPQLAAVRGFYEAAAADDFDRAWELAGPGFRKAFGSQASLERQLSSLEKIEFRTLELVDPGTVRVATTATHTNRVDRCTGTLRAVQVGGEWRVDPLGLNCRSG